MENLILIALIGILIVLIIILVVLILNFKTFSANNRELKESISKVVDTLNEVTNID